MTPGTLRPPGGAENAVDGRRGRRFDNLVFVSTARETTTNGASRGAGAGVVSYRLARRRLVDAHARGRVTTEEICDAQPELRRVAASCSNPLSEPCPICDGDQLVAVTFAFGPGLPKHGRVVDGAAEMARLRRRGRPSTCYLLEVCRECWWNHLRESFTLSG